MYVNVPIYYIIHQNGAAIPPTPEDVGFLAAILMKRASITWVGEDSRELAERLIPSDVDEIALTMSTGDEKNIDRDHAIITLSNALGVSDHPEIKVTTDVIVVRGWRFVW